MTMAVSRSSRRRRWSAGLAAAALAAGVVHAQDRETLETEVTVAGSEVTFKWSRKHPWDAELIARGVSLFAEYRTARGGGLECLQPRAGTLDARGGRGVGAGTCFAGNPVLRGEDRTIHFQLPDALTAEPLGPVCLQFRLPDQRILPIRRANKLGEDTARFQVEEWARNATVRARQEALESRRAGLRAAIGTQSTEVAEQVQANDARGWTSAAACSTQQAGTVDLASSGRPIAEPRDHDSTARQVCMLNVDREGKYVSSVKSPEHLPSLVDHVDADMRERWLAIRGAQVKQFLDDWVRYGATADDYLRRHRVPHFGKYDDPLVIPSLAGRAGMRVFAALRSKAAPDKDDVLGVWGATAEAYDRCIRDGTRQLDLNYREAQALAATVQTLPERLREQAVQACQAGVDRLTSMRTRLAGFEQELATVEAEMAQLAPVPLSKRSRELNAVGCTP